MRFQSYGKSDIGKVRSNNEDSFLIDEEIGLLILADGMGSHNSGEVASRLAVNAIYETMQNFLFNDKKITLEQMDPRWSPQTHQLVWSIRFSNQLIHDTGNTKVEHKGMGTTVEALLLRHNTISIGHVGDSRVYFVRDGRIKQLTEDHSLIAQQIKKGLIHKEFLERLTLQNVLLRAVGIQEKVEIDQIEMEANADDFFLLCSDGLTKMVQDHEMLETVLQLKSPKDVVEHLIDCANKRGGVDNTTVMAARILHGADAA